MKQVADEWHDRLFAQFREETDRAAILVAAAMMDTALELLLAKLLAPPLKAERSLLASHRGPLGTFSARIDAAYQLGLISQYMARDLHLIRELRNDCAHHTAPVTFATPSIRDRVRALDESSDYNRRNPKERADMGPPGPRHDFLGCAGWMLYALHRGLDDVVPRKPRSPEFGYIDWDKLPAEIKALIQSSQAP